MRLAVLYSSAGARSVRASPESCIQGPHFVGLFCSRAGPQQSGRALCTGDMESVVTWLSRLLRCLAPAPMVTTWGAKRGQGYCCLVLMLDMWHGGAQKVVGTNLADPQLRCLQLEDTWRAEQGRGGARLQRPAPNLGPPHRHRPGASAARTPLTLNGTVGA